MILLPAIDVKDGLCVRLYQGDYAQVTTYDSDPVRVARRWKEAGASWLHVVDLDGAVLGQPVIPDLIKRMREATDLHIEVGGGLRSLAHIEQVLSAGADRVILGTVAITNRPLLQEAVERWGEQIVVGLDARDGWVAISGWRETSKVRAVDLAHELCDVVGVRRFVYTDIARDGALSGPNLPALQEMQAASSAALIASGGVSSLADLHALAQLGVEGTIVGKAIYTGDVDLAIAIREIER
ncbi:1-(5-phosphoribosyl)-5-[(5-phosphoribosylamino)methylideneamino]imidazole-4-carboxamide isomerase [Tengunoibacter tsumagoiensis]|uniref:1-(5-phosphoribosyl)-5-[(5-phosphoribosylamino)methylideneamino] imidazole-4-carboxamide isomerase n=1 Tax=Tengunoibacter tsumagoiensis TaxID=2014871 RepID=A0A402A0Y9_9CHLR|nr:1-(5-phosphoribosyl)-5-[(5-phosphoribosylamino)methylideneamino]imidazole-4-carboxamide isomerase [Tengunoibacter tsumagoiensis]GCE12719.1 1-(5-phosphoribosyl)-5-[(5-phosphoribosylamino) methylideneamino] imidazole-4-carboxamide isomerase [Tengunoibacter tsumagoiensis]